MNSNNLQVFVNDLCADDLTTLLNIINTNGDAILTSNVSNHKIIQREHSKDSMHSCPLCGSISIVKNGHTKANRQKYCCKDCKKSFSDTTNTIAYRSRKSYKDWIEVISDTLGCKPLRQTAEVTKISKTTVFAMRHKILETLSSYKKDNTNNLSTTIEADSMYFPINLKGIKTDKMPRMSKKRTSSAKRGISNHKVCVFTAIDDQDHTLIEIAGLGPESIDMLKQFKERFDENSLLITDSKSSYIEFASSRNMELDQVPSGFRISNNGNNINTVNGLQSQLRTFLSPFRGVSIRHLQSYLNLFRYYKDLKYTTGYTNMNNKTYCYAMPHYTQIFINDIYNKQIPIDLYKAYGEYKYGIFANQVA
jgi:transposase-like protein